MSLVAKTEKDGQRECGLGREALDHMSDGSKSGRASGL